MKITIAKSAADQSDSRVALIECIVQKIYRLDIDVLRKVYLAIAKVLDDLDGGKDK